MARKAEEFYYGSPQAASLSSRNSTLATYSDTDELAHIAKGFVLSADATIKFLPADKTLDADAVTFAFPKGSYQMSIRKIYATGTTATAGTILLLV